MELESRTAALVIAAQLAVTLLAGVFALAISGFHAAWSASVGGLISTLASLYFALRVLAPTRGAAIRSVVRTFYVGEAQKLVLTAVMFYVAIKWMDVVFLPLILTYTATLFVYWLALPFSLETR